MEKKEGVFVLWLGREGDKRRMMEEKERNNRWRQFLIEEWLSPEEWVRNAKEKGERLRKAKYEGRYRGEEEEARRGQKRDLIVF